MVQTRSLHLDGLVASTSVALYTQPQSPAYRGQGWGWRGRSHRFPAWVPPVSLPTAKGLPGHKEHGSADAKGGKRHSSSSLELQRIINNFVIAPAGGKAGRMDFPQNIHTQQSDVRHGAASFYQRNVRKQEV